MFLSFQLFYFSPEEYREMVLFCHLEDRGDDLAEIFYQIKRQNAQVYTRDFRE